MLTGEAVQQTPNNIPLRNSLHITCETDYFKALYLTFEPASPLWQPPNISEVDQANELKSIAQEMAGLKKTYEDVFRRVDILKGTILDRTGAVNYNYATASFRRNIARRYGR